jgi:hypothetical protein
LLLHLLDACTTGAGRRARRNGALCAAHDGCVWAGRSLLRQQRARRRASTALHAAPLLMVNVAVR